MLLFFQLTRNTFRECLREPVFFLTIAAALLVIGSLPAVTLFVFSRQLYMILDNALALTLLLGFVAAALCATRCIRREMMNGTVLLLLSKPVPRFAYITAKILGINGAMAVFAVICCSATMIAALVALNPFHIDRTALLLYFLVFGGSAAFGAVRNYLSQVSFAANTILALLFSLPVLAGVCYGKANATLTVNDELSAMASFLPFAKLFPALLLIVLAVLLIATISAAFATRFSFLTNLFLCLGVFLAGLVSGPLMNRIAGVDSFAAAIVGLLIPDWQRFWMSSALSTEAVIPASYVGWSVLYVAVYGIVWTLWAAALFQNSELAKDSRV